MINSITIQPEGKILVGGWFTTYKGITQNRIARLNTNGTLDTSFAIGTGIERLQADGKILDGGYFETYQGLTKIDLHGWWEQNYLQMR